MDDLISRQALRSEMYHEAFEKDTEDQRWDSGCWIRYRMFERIIDSIPSATPEIVSCEDCRIEMKLRIEKLPSAQHTGRWIVVDEQEPRRYGCSECKRLVWHIENYCPNCGCAMKGEEE